MRQLLVAVGLSLLGLASCPAPPAGGTQCQIDTQCPSAFRCDRQRAVCIPGSRDAGPADVDPADHPGVERLDSGPPDQTAAGDRNVADSSTDAAAASDGAAADRPVDAAPTSDAADRPDGAADAGAVVDGALAAEASIATDAAMAADAAIVGVDGALSADAGVPACPYPTVLRAGQCQAARVLVLEDDSFAGANLTQAMRVAGFDAVTGGRFHSWDGASPSLADRDSVLILQGAGYDQALTTGAQQTLVEFVAAGGGLVRTEWAVWRNADDALRPLLPVDSSAAFGHGYTWKVLDPAHPLTRELADQLAVAGGYVQATLRADGTAVLSTVEGVPVASFTRLHGGTSVHLNHDVTFSAIMEAHVRQLYLNAVWFAAQR